MKRVIFYRVAAAAALFAAGALFASGAGLDAAGFFLAAGLLELAAWVRAERRIADAEVAAGASARAVAKVRVATLLDAVENNAPVALRIGQHPPSWLLGARWALDAARKVIKEGEL